MKTHFSLLDGVRFFAAFWVMNFHYLFVLGLSSEVYWYRYGNLGVQLFFIISGFVIVQSLSGKTMRDFLIGRFVRLFPLFWILCTLTYISTLIVPHAKALHFNEYLVSMTMLADTINELGNTTLRLVDPSYWTLGVELIFYIAIAIFVSLFSYSKIRYFLLAWLVLSIVAFMHHTDQTFYMKLALVRHTSYFVFGGALALIITKQAASLLERNIDWLLLIGSALYSLIIRARAIPAYTVPNPLDPLVITCILSAFFVGVIGIVYLSPVIKHKKVVELLAALGGLTYPLYLLHQTIGNILINFLTDMYNIPWDTFAICFEVFMILAAYVVYTYDKKMRSWLMSKLYDSTPSSHEVPSVPAVAAALVL